MLRALRLISTVIVVSLGAAQLSAQDGGQFAVLIDGLGSYSRPISTKSELAQKFFDQGLRLTYGYYSPEAVASFREALRHDSDNPMIYWGLALALGPIPNSRFRAFPDDPKEEGRKAIAAARVHEAKGTPVEQALIETLSVRYDSDRYVDRDLRDEQYIEAARKTHQQYPADLEAAYLYVDAPSNAPRRCRGWSTRFSASGMRCLLSRCPRMVQHTCVVFGITRGAALLPHKQSSTKLLKNCRHFKSRA